MNTENTKLIRLLLYVVLLTAAQIYFPAKANAIAASYYCNERLVGKNSVLQVISDEYTTTLSPEQKSIIEEMRQFLRAEEEAVRISRAASRIRFQRDENGRVRTDAPVAVIFHGLLNSPSWFQKMEATAFAGGHHILNIRLPGHYTKKPKDLDRVTSDEWMHSVREAIRWAKIFSSDITFIGHSTGALGGLIVNAERPGLIKKMLLFSPAFQLSKALRLKIKAATSLWLSGWVLGPPIDNERYVSSWAGVQVQQLSEIAANLNSQNNFAHVLGALEKTEIIWVDTQLDKTLDVNLNIELAGRLQEVAPQLQYILLDKAVNISHDQNGAFGFQGTGTIPLYSQVREFLRALED